MNNEPPQPAQPSEPSQPNLGFGPPPPSSGYEQQEIFCPNCGGVNQAGAATCKWCGASIAASDAAPVDHQVMGASYIPPGASGAPVPSSGFTQPSSSSPGCWNAIGGVLTAVVDGIQVIECCSIFGLILFAGLLAPAALLSRVAMAMRRKVRG